MTSAVMQAKLWYWQRASAIILAAGVLVHLGVMIYAVRGGLSAAEILGRTHGSRLFGALYTLLVLSCAVHVPIGLVAIAEEWAGWRGSKVVIGAGLFSAVIVIMGLRAVYGVVAA
jgi:fumarate reductase subunit C